MKRHAAHKTRKALTGSKHAVTHGARWLAEVREAGAILWLIYSPITTTIVALGGTYSFMKLNHMHDETALTAACIVAASAFLEHASSERAKLRKERAEALAERRPMFSYQARRLVVGVLALGAIAIASYLVFGR